MNIFVSIRNFWIWSKYRWYINPYYWWFWYYLSFVEEGILNPNYKGFIGGRVEIWTQWSQYDVDELRFLTKDVVGYCAFREENDLKNLSYFGLRKFKTKLKKFYDQD